MSCRVLENLPTISWFVAKIRGFIKLLMCHKLVGHIGLSGRFFCAMGHTFVHLFCSDCATFSKVHINFEQDCANLDIVFVCVPSWEFST